jgi:hypothetical protein
MKGAVRAVLCGLLFPHGWADSISGKIVSPGQVFSVPFFSRFGSFFIKGNL